MCRNGSALGVLHTCGGERREGGEMDGMTRYCCDVMMMSYLPKHSLEEVIVAVNVQASGHVQLAQVGMVTVLKHLQLCC